MATQNLSYPQVERRKPPQKDQPAGYGWALYLIVITLLLVAGYFVSYDHLYEPGDDIGYNLGLAGGLMMLSLLLYPMRKRFRFMRNWIILPKWFKWHMVFGVLGPTLVMFHSTFRIESINAGVAMACMMISSGSGIFGRFFYTKVHYGLYGRQITFQQLQKDVQGSAEAKSILSFAPAIQRRLADFHDRSMRLSEQGRIGLWNFMILGIRTSYFSWSIIRDLKKSMFADAKKKRWNSIQMKRLNQIYAENEKSIRAYVNAVRDMAEFSTYERLFSLWHIFHVPIVYLLVPSAIWHVIAVHRY